MATVMILHSCRDLCCRREANTAFQCQTCQHSIHVVLYKALVSDGLGRCRWLVFLHFSAQLSCLPASLSNSLSCLIMAAGKHMRSGTAESHHVLPSAVSCYLTCRKHFSSGRLKFVLFILACKDNTSGSVRHRRTPLPLRLSVNSAVSRNIFQPCILVLFP